MVARPLTEGMVRKGGRNEGPSQITERPAAPGAMVAGKFSNAEKLRELDREIEQRHRVYKRLIAKGTLSRETATRQIAILSAVADDYRDKAKEGPLFDTPFG